MIKRRRPLQDKAVQPPVARRERNVVRKVDVNRALKTQILRMVSEGSSIREAITTLHTSWQQYYKLTSKDATFKSRILQAKEGRSQILNEKFYEKNVKPIADEDYHNMDEFDLQVATKRNRVIESAQTIMGNFQKSDLPHLHGKGVDHMTVDNSSTLNFNINMKQLEKVVDTFKPKVIEGEIISGGRNGN